MFAMKAQWSGGSACGYVLFADLACTIYVGDCGPGELPMGAIVIPGTCYL